MAHVTFIDLIATVSGKLVKRHHTTYMVRRATTSNPVMLANPCFTMVLGKRQTAPSESEQQYCERFGAICKATTERLHDSTQAPADVLAFQSQNAFMYNLRSVCMTKTNSIKSCASSRPYMIVSVR